MPDRMGPAVQACSFGFGGKFDAPIFSMIGHITVHHSSMHSDFGWDNFLLDRQQRLTLEG